MMQSDDVKAGSFRVEQIMGMPIEIDLRDDAPAEVLDGIFDWFRWVDRTFSAYDANSEVSRLNRGLLPLSACHSDVRVVLQRCDKLQDETQGYFDIRTDNLPVSLEMTSGGTSRTGIDPSGYVKGWSVDRAAAMLEEAGIVNYSVNAGGDVRVGGGALPDAIWRIGIRHPLEREKVAMVVAASDASVATSGAYERGLHIADPHTGSPPEGVLSVTVVGPRLGDADAYATAIFAMGVSGPTWAAGLFGYETMVILADHTVLKTHWFPDEE